MAKKKNKRWILMFELNAKGENSIGDSVDFHETISLKLNSASYKKALIEACALWTSFDRETVISHAKHKKSIIDEDVIYIFNPKLVFSEKCDFDIRELIGSL